MRHAILGDDIVHVVLARRAHRPGRECGLDLADRASLCRRGEGDKALAALRLGRAADIIDLPAGAGHVLCADALGTDLPPEVDLQRCVDRDHVVVPADDVRVVDIVHRHQRDGRVVVDIIIDPLRAEGKGRDGNAAVDLLAAVVHRAAGDQLDHRVGEHLGVDAEIVLFLQRHAGRVRDRADAQLDAGAVRDQLGDIAADGAAGLVDVRRRQHGQRHIVLHDAVDLADMDLQPAHGAGLAVVDLEEDAFGFLDHRLAVRRDAAE